MENLRVTEIHYHPLDESDDDNDDGEYEFVELKNIGDETLDLSGINFSRGITYSFPNYAALGPNKFIVLASNKSAFYTRYGFQAFGEYQGRLDNNGETLALNSAAEDTIIKIRYTDQYPWPNSADGDGYSIVPRAKDPYQDQNEAVNWMASREIHGNPGRDNIPVSVQELQRKIMQAEFKLMQNYPNPFNAVTTIQFYVPKKTFLTLKVYNILGEEVDEPVSRYFEPGHHSYRWHAANFASGVYFYRLITSTGYVLSKKLLLLK